MRYRRPQVAGGQFVKFLLMTEGTFDTPAAVHAAEVGAAIGQPVTIVEGDTDPWDGVSVLLIPTPSAPNPSQPLTAFTQAEVAALPANGPGPLTTAKTILAKLDADITAAEIKTLVLLMARYLLRKWVVEGWR